MVGNLEKQNIRVVEKKIEISVDAGTSDQVRNSLVIVDSHSIL